MLERRRQLNELRQGSDQAQYPYLSSMSCVSGTQYMLANRKHAITYSGRVRGIEATHPASNCEASGGLPLLATVSEQSRTFSWRLSARLWLSGVTPRAVGARLTASQLSIGAQIVTAHHPGLAGMAARLATR